MDKVFKESGEVPDLHCLRAQISWLRVSRGLGIKCDPTNYCMSLHARAKRIKLCLRKSRRWKSSQVGEKSLKAGKRGYRVGNSDGRLGEKTSGCGAEIRFEKENQISEVSLMTAPKFFLFWTFGIFLFSRFRNPAASTGSYFPEPLEGARTSCSTSSSKPTTDHCVCNKRSGHASTESRAPVRSRQDCHPNFLSLPWRSK